MIDEIAIRGIGVIEEAEIRLGPGFTAVTGETGAGKTMVVTALGLLLGDRGDAGLLRVGEEAARVEARLRPVPPAAVAGGFAGETDEEMVISRELIPGEDGLRSRVRIGGRLATVTALAEVLGSAVEVHTQGVHLRLSRPLVQRTLLDRYAGDAHVAALDGYRHLYAEWSECVAQLEELRTGERERAREIDRLRHEIDEIGAAALDPQADGRLEAEIGRLEHVEQLLESASAAVTALSEEGAGSSLGVLVASLRRAAEHDEELDVLRERAEALVAEAEDLRAALRGYQEGLEHDPVRLEELRRRRSAITELTRKYGADVASVLTYADDARARLDALVGKGDDADALEQRATGLEQELEQLASDLSTGRQDAAKRLADAVEGHLAELNMPHAAFVVRVEPRDELGRDGRDTVTFLLSANPGQEPRPLADAVSGGERSRLALAVEVALADVDDARVLVFDEVDAGVGGATALAVGEKLARLASGAGGRQVVCVTHLAQLAAFADTHHVVEKRVAGGRTVTSVREVATEERVGELSRMLSGEPERETGLAHARELLADAAARRG